MEKKGNIVIYGASGGGKKVFLTLQNMGIKVDFFVDSDSEKWGTKFCEKEVRSPQEITNDKKIIIASELNQEKIEFVLDEYGLLDNIIMKEEIMLHFMKKNFLAFLKNKKKDIDSERIFFELLEGVPQEPDGIADWTKDAATLLDNSGKAVKIIASKKLGMPQKDVYLYDFIETDYSTYWSDVKKLVDYLEQNLPCTVVLNKQMQLFYAAAIIKEVYGKQIKIISVVHSDAKCLYLRSKLIDSYVDDFVATSTTIKSNLLKYGISKNKIKYETLPIKKDNSDRHIYSKGMEPIKIAYAGRLTKEVKRCDLLIELIKCLEKVQCNYKFFIAGSGDYREKIEEFIKNWKLTNKVSLCGKIDKEQIGTFWNDKDICVVVSDKEGCCISMAEAMMMGTVPVTTNFAAAKEYNLECQYGFLVEKDDVGKMAEIISNLELDKSSLENIGNHVQKYAERKFDYEKYGFFLESVVGGDSDRA